MPGDHQYFWRVGEKEANSLRCKTIRTDGSVTPRMTPKNLKKVYNKENERNKENEKP